MASVVQAFDTGTRDVRFGIVTYDDRGAQYVLNFRDGTNYARVFQTIQQLREGGSTFAEFTNAFDLILSQQVSCLRDFCVAYITSQHTVWYLLFQTVICK